MRVQAVEDDAVIRSPRQRGRSFPASRPAARRCGLRCHRECSFGGPLPPHDLPARLGCGQTYRLPRDKARETAEERFEHYPNAAYLTRVESRRVADDGGVHDAALGKW